MARTFVRPDAQIRNSVSYNDGLTPGATLESGATTLEDDLNALRTQLKAILGQTNWYDTLADRSLSQVDTDLASVEAKTMLGRVSVLTDITVGAGLNYHVLSVAGSETPTLVIGIDSYSDPAAAVAVCAQSALSGAGFSAHELTEVAGFNALVPKNLCVVVEAATGQPPQSDVGSGVLRDIYALLQVESTATDGSAFNDTSAGQRGKLSFVRVNSAGTDLEAVPFADIQNKVINYAYVRRAEFITMPEDISLSGSFIDQAASVDVTLQNAYANGNTIEVTSGVGPLAITLTSADFTVDGAQNVAFGAVTDLTSFTVDSGTVSVDTTGNINIDSTTGNIEIGEVGGTGNLLLGRGLTDIEIGANAVATMFIDAGTIYIGDGGQDNAINIGTTNDNHAISIGSTTGTSSLVLEAGTNGITADTNTGGTISLDAVGAASNFSIATTAADQDLTLSVTGATDSSVIIQSSGTGSDAIGLGATAGGIVISAPAGTLAADAATVDIDATGGNLSLNSATGAINVGNDAVNGDINIGTAGSRTIQIGQSGGTGITRIYSASTTLPLDILGQGAVLVQSGTGNIQLTAGADLIVRDQYKTGSTFSGDLQLSDATAEWDAYEAAFGEVSLLSAIVQAKTSAARTKTVAVVTSNIAADTNVTGAGGTPNIDAVLGDYSGVTFTTDVDIFLNGQLMRCGANSGANYDVYPGDTPANGDLKFEFALVATPGSPDVITMVINGS